jgi:RNA polymerase sigma-70 factor (ECF subfamily)
MWLLWAVIDAAGSPERWAEDRAADRSALERMARGDQTALAELYDRHARPVYSLALRIVQDPSDAEDVVQDVFSQAWRQASRYDAARGAVGAWLLTVARSRAIDRLRAKRVRPDVAAPAKMVRDVLDPAVLQDAQLVSGEQVARVRSALAELPMPQRSALELAYYEGLTHAEIAARLKEPLGTVKTRIRLAMMKLRDALAGAV